MADPSLAELEARLAALGDAPTDPVEHIDALNALAWGARNSDSLRANGLARQARQLSMDHGYTLGQARAARTMAMSLVDADAIRTVFDLAEEAKRLFDQTDDLAGKAASRDFLSSLHEYVGDLAGGLDLALDALGLAQELGDPVRQGYALSSVGGILAASGEVDNAVVRLKEALGLFESVGNHVGVGAISSRLCRVLKDGGRTEEALSYAATCRKMASINGDDYSEWAALTVMGEVQEEQGDPAEAERLYREALASTETQPMRNIVGTKTQITLGRLLTEQGSLDDAEHELTDALSRVQGNTVSVVTETTAHEALANLFERRGKLDLTVQHLRKAQTLREKISQQDTRNKLAQVEVRSDMVAAKKDAEIQKLRFVELHGMQSKLVEAEKMALLGKLAAGMAHELNSPLGVLNSNGKLSATAAERLIALLGKDAPAGAQASKLATVLESCNQSSGDALKRIASIAQSFGRFTQLDQAEQRSFDVREGLGSAMALLEPTVGEGVTLERRFEPVPEILGWPRELNHAFMTVLQNAAQAIDGEGTLVAETGLDNGQVLVRIRDTGRGMDQEQVAHLFDVAWSEDGSRTRMRLGLSAAYTTTQKHGGTIDVESAPGKGTAVSFRFPVAAH